MLQYPNKNANKRDSKKVSKYHHQQGAARNDHSSDIYFAHNIWEYIYLCELYIACLMPFYNFMMRKNVVVIYGRNQAIR